VVDAALLRSANKSSNVKSAPAAKTRAAAAGAQFAASASDAPEFEVTSASEGWSADPANDGTGSDNNT